MFGALLLFFALYFMLFFLGLFDDLFDHHARIRKARRSVHFHEIDEE